MPTYGYICDSCEQELEAFQRMSDAPLRTCPACGKETLRRQIFATGIVFKGSGFYKTDYGAKKSASAESSSDGSGSTAKKEGSATPDSAPPAKDKSASAAD